MNENKQVATLECKAEVVAPLTAQAMRTQVNLIQEVMTEVMQGPSKDNPNGVHYGIIPGCGDKPTLFKAGAEKLSLTFRLRPVMGDGDIDVIDMGNGHREYRIRCHILNSNGLEMATGVGSASTMESKHRYRNVSDFELTGKPIPNDSKEKKQEYAKQGYGMKKVENVWQWVKFKEVKKTENTDIADVYNTVLKMAKKRAYVDGILSATACSDIFTQDIEDLPIAHIVDIPKEEKTEQASKPEIQTPQRKSAQEPTAEQLKELAEKGAKEYHNGETPKEAPKTPPQASQTPTTLSAIGLVRDQKEPNGWGYVVYYLENYQKDDGKDVPFSTKDKKLIDIIEDRLHDQKVHLEYTITTNAKGYTNYNIVGASLVEQGVVK